MEPSRRILTHPLLHACLAVLASALLWVLLAPQFMRGLDVPLMWHPDEWTKVEQLQQDERNYNHPLLMLETTRIAMEWLGTERSDAAIVRVGRQTSAWFAAGAGAFLALAGYAAGRWRGFLLVGSASALTPALFAHAHFMKEDAALAFGTSMVACAAATLCAARRRSLYAWTVPATAFLGAAVGVAASAKYSGAVFAVPAIVLTVIVAARRRRWWWGVPTCVLLLSICAAGTWAGINHRAFDEWVSFREGFDREYEHGTTNHRDVTLAKPTAYFADAVWTDAMPHVKASTIGCAILLPIAFTHRRRWRRRDGSRPTSTLFGAWLVLTAACYLVAISYSSIPFFRYALPVSLQLSAIAGLGVCYVSDAIGARRGWAGWMIVIVGAAFIVIVQGRRCADYAWQIEHDSKARLAEWVNANLPPRTFIVADGYTQLLGANGFRRGRSANRDPSASHAVVWRGMLAADYGSLVWMRRAGVRYVAIAGTSYERYLSPHALAAPGSEAEFESRRTFYQELFERFPIVWKAKADHPMQTFANPDIYVFKVDEK